MRRRGGEGTLPSRLAAACLAVVALLVLGGAGRAAEPYRTKGDCDGFPRVGLSTLPGLCVGLVAEHLGFPRGIAVIGAAVYIVDMGGWRKGHGRLLRLGDHGRGAPEILLSGLDEPSTVVARPDGTLYVALLDRIVAVDPLAADPASSLRDVVTGLPGSGLHPLPVFAVASDGSLYVNVGGASDHCEGEGGRAPDPAQACPETQLPLPRGTTSM